MTVIRGLEVADERANNLPIYTKKLNTAYFITGHLGTDDNSDDDFVGISELGELLKKDIFTYAEECSGFWDKSELTGDSEYFFSNKKLVTKFYNWIKKELLTQEIELLPYD